jgi:hypothetical protein
MSGGMNTRRDKAGLVLGVVFLMIPARWASAAEALPAAAAPATVEASTPRDEPWSPALQAMNLMRIDGAAFYDAVGRPDLASRYGTRHALQITGRVVGGLSLGLGVLSWVAVKALLAGFKLPYCAINDPDPACHRDETLWVPDLMMAGGAALIVATLGRTDPVSDDEKAELAYDAARRPPSPLPLGLNVSITPQAGSDGATLMLAGRF